MNEVTGQDYRWFFDQTWFSAEECRAMRQPYQHFYDSYFGEGRASTRQQMPRETALISLTYL